MMLNKSAHAPVWYRFGVTEAVLQTLMFGNKIRKVQIDKPKVIITESLL